MKGVYAAALKIVDGKISPISTLQDAIKSIVAWMLSPLAKTHTPVAFDIFLRDEVVGYCHIDNLSHK